MNPILSLAVMKVLAVCDGNFGKYAREQVVGANRQPRTVVVPTQINWGPRVQIPQQHVVANSSIL
jgi:hypothetical protein